MILDGDSAARAYRKANSEFRKKGKIMDLELKGRVAIVTGGSKGIGRAIALGLAKEGVDVAICARTRETLETTAKQLALETGRTIIPIVADMTKTSEVKSLVEQTVRELGRVDILVNNAAVVGGQVRGVLAEAEETDLSQDLDTKVVGYFRCIKEVAPYMQSQKWGRIINIGGLSARQASIYGLRNAAVAHLTKTLSDQLGGDGITVNVIHPGNTRTENVERRLQQQAAQQNIDAEELVQKNSQNVAIKRSIFPEELAYLVAFLSSPRAECITGESIAAGGGAMGAVFQ